jgi:hypothetical protein
MSRPAPFRIAILISGRGSNMTAITRACLAGSINAEVARVISDRTEAAGLAAARDLGAPTATVARTPGLPPADFEAQLMQAIDASRPDAIALAGFMRILSTSFVERYLGRLLNIHHSILPAYRTPHASSCASLKRCRARDGAFVTPARCRPGIAPVEGASAPGNARPRWPRACRRPSTSSTPGARLVAQRRLQWHDGARSGSITPLETPIVEDFRAAAL